MGVTDRDERERERKWDVRERYMRVMGTEEKDVKSWCEGERYLW